MGTMITPDFTEAVEFVTLPPGTYTARLTGCESKVSQAGNPRLNWKFTTFGSDKAELNNQTIFYGTNLNGKGSGFLRELLSLLSGEKWESGRPFDPEQFFGREIKLSLVAGKTQTGEPSNYPEVKSIGKI